LGLQAGNQAFAVLYPAPITPFDVGNIAGAVIPFKYRLQYQASATPPSGALAPTLSWFQGLCNPSSLAKRGLHASLQTVQPTIVLNPDTQITQDYESRWHFAWSEPVRIKPGLRAELQQFQPTIVLDPETQITQNYESRWHQGWSIPSVLAKQGLRTGDQQFTADRNLSPIVSFSWFNELSKPRSLEKPGLDVSLQQFTTSNIDPIVPLAAGNIPGPNVVFSYSFQYQALGQPPAIVTPEVITQDKWHFAWSEPIRLKPGLFASAQQDLAWHTETPPQVIIEWWQQAWSELVRDQAFEVVSENLSFGVVEPVITVGHWLRPWSEPVRQKIGLGAHLQQAFTVDPDALTRPEAVSEDKWHQPWSVPTLRKPNLAGYPSFSWNTETPPQVVVEYWHAPWSEPIKVKSGLAASEQQFTTHFGIQNFFPVAAGSLGPTFVKKTVYQQQAFLSLGWQIDDLRWHQPWSIPSVLTKVGLSVKEQPTTVLGAVPIIPEATTWLYSWSEPVRTKAGLGAQLQQFFTVDPDALTRPEAVSEDKWHQAWSEPVRIRPALRTGLQQDLAWNSIIIIPEVITQDKWYRPLSEPKRFKQWVGAERVI